MATDFEIKCALMAGASYISNRPDKNTFPTPDGWIVRKDLYATKPSGFEAVSFQNGNEIVISFTGTNGSGDWPTNIALADGNYCDQLLDAAKYYLEIKKNNPNATITLTGHSLGGGLAALMAVFFDEKAVTFDQAPFRATAYRDVPLEYFPESTAQILYNWLIRDYSADDLAKLKTYVDSFTDSDPSENELINRESKVTSISVEGEVLTGDFIDKLKIGTQNTILEHGGTNVSGIDLHSIALLNAFLLDKRFRDVTGIKGVKSLLGSWLMPTAFRSLPPFAANSCS